MWQHYPPRMRKAIATALEEAARLGHDEAAPEHLLLAITRDPDCGACFMLSQSAVSGDAVRRELDSRTMRGSARLQRAARLSSQTMHILDVAEGESHRIGDHHVGT